MNARLSLVTLASLSTFAAAAMAADATNPQAASVILKPAPAATTERAQPAPSATTGAAVRPALTADQKVLENVLERGQAEIAALTQSAQAMPEGAARLSIERKVVEAKLRWRVEFLRTLAGQQRAKGEVAAAQNTDALIDQLLHPKPLPARNEPQSPNRSGAVK